jgi:hypothetical protein
MLLRPSNENFVPASEPPFRFTSGALWSLLRSPGLGVGFHNNKFSNPASRSAKMPAAFCLEHFGSDAGTFPEMPPRRRGVAAPGRLAVPDITGYAGIQLNERVSLRRADEILSSPQSYWIWPTPPTIRPCIPRDQGSPLPSLGAAAPPKIGIGLPCPVGSGNSFG